MEISKLGVLEAGSELAVAPNEAEITLGLLVAVERDSAVTQRGIAGELGIALGLTNAYLKRCVKKGWIKISDAPRNRYLYYLTPQGFTEKSRLTAEYLSQSFRFFRAARNQCAELLVSCRERGWHHMALAGRGDLAEIAMICAQIEGIKLAAILDETGGEFLGLPVLPMNMAGQFDAIFVTDLATPQQRYDELLRHQSADRLFTPAFLRVKLTNPSLSASAAGSST